jgi:hypothetical protein
MKAPEIANTDDTHTHLVRHSPATSDRNSRAGPIRRPGARERLVSPTQGATIHDKIQKSRPAGEARRVPLGVPAAEGISERDQYRTRGGRRGMNLERAIRPQMNSN